MARISDRARHLVREKLAAATGSVRAERGSGAQQGMDFERALRILDQCSAAFEALRGNGHPPDRYGNRRRVLLTAPRCGSYSE